ncbi:hypothetical protein CIL05_00570 [Virgibacillus profundi]|uniref:Uncharacterized protein n=1 Tax=Virgibacillus profundi TaxID=2024555 RepID=A0A2A2III3_9BACI|nr:hypothetical protein [Virgibacillus profundi]PAV31188.1 hypothetical protein CIL05_00570 [Virgibacillus profundi]PXY55370.1 hypothetical protein CIT14_00570 [Virgibacillus profundi]
MSELGKFKGIFQRFLLVMVMKIKLLKDIQTNFETIFMKGISVGVVASSNEWIAKDCWKQASVRLAITISIILLYLKL